MTTTRGNARRRALLEKAGEMFLSHGYDAISIDALISEVGGSRRNIYSTYNNKEGLFEAAVRELCEQYVRPISELSIKTSCPQLALADFASELLTSVLKPSALALQRLMIAESHRLPNVSQAIFTAGHERVVAILAGWLEEGQLKGAFRQDLPPARLADLFVNMVVTGPQLRANIGLIVDPLDPSVIRAMAVEGTTLFLKGALV